MFGGGGQEVDDARDKAESDRTVQCSTLLVHCTCAHGAGRQQHRLERIKDLRKQAEAGLSRKPPPAPAAQYGRAVSISAEATRKPAAAVRVEKGILQIGDVSCPVRMTARRSSVTSHKSCFSIPS